MIWSKIINKVARTRNSLVKNAMAISTPIDKMKFIVVCRQCEIKLKKKRKRKECLSLVWAQTTIEYRSSALKAVPWWCTPAYTMAEFNLKTKQAILIRMTVMYSWNVHIAQGLNCKNMICIIFAPSKIVHVITMCAGYVHYRNVRSRLSIKRARCSPRSTDAHSNRKILASSVSGHAIWMIQITGATSKIMVENVLIKFRIVSILNLRMGCNVVIAFSISASNAFYRCQVLMKFRMKNIECS